MSNDTTTYLVKLKPVSSYYFGGERSFGLGEKQNYLVTSRKWPQQTTLLGMVRYLLLREHGLLAEKGKTVPEAAKELIGSRSFRLGTEEEQFGASLDFKQIKALDPVFLMDEEATYYPAPLTNGMKLNPAKGHLFYQPGERKKAYLLEGYDPKEGLKHQVIDPNTGHVIPESEIFQEVSQVGIEKGRDGQPKTEAFYKQTSMAFNTIEKRDTGLKDDEGKPIIEKIPHNWYFAFYLTVSSDTSLPAETLLPMGGEQRLFSWTAEKATSQKPEWSEKAKGTDRTRLLLLSDSLVPNTIYEKCEFAVTETLDFRFIHTDINKTSRYHNISKDKDSQDLVKSDKFTLLRKGSVLYSDSPGDLESLLKSERLQSIGYNHFQPLTS